MVFGVCSVKVFQAFLPDVGIAMVGVFSYAVCFILTALANDSNMLYIGTVNTEQAKNITY